MSKSTDSHSNAAAHELNYRSIITVLDSLDALVYVSDMQTHELLFVNQYGRDIWGDIKGKQCWAALQRDQNGPCDFCTNNKLRDSAGRPTGVYVWEFQNTINKRWYECRDQAIEWVDGRIVRMEIATDITHRKQVEDELLEAKKQAEMLAYKDELTGLNNRRAFFDQGDRSFKQATRFKHPISVIMMDIDYFKRVNDNFGHTVGDKVLRIISNLMKNMVRDIDIVARIGGEEFAFILPETGLDEAVSLAERVRQSIENCIIEDNNNRLQITVSMGISTCVPENDTLEQMLIKADDALYIAKKKGRNQIKTCL
jgi:diguanylate cyclase (GGDEF)-like protein